MISENRSDKIKKDQESGIYSWKSHKEMRERCRAQLLAS